MYWILIALIYVGFQVFLIAVLPAFGMRLKPIGNNKIFIFDSPKPIAFATGMLWFKKVIVSTGLDILTEDEYCAVLRHEFGHHALAHIPKMIGLYTVLALLVAYLMSLIGVINIWVFIPYCLVMIMIISNLLEPVFNWISKKFELQADQFCKSSGLQKHLCSALIKLNNKGKTHPPLKERLEALRGIESTK